MKIFRKKTSNICWKPPTDNGNIPVP